MTKPLVIGIGNSLRGDDGLGPLVVANLQQTFAESVDFIVNPKDALSLINSWHDREAVYLVDACYEQQLAAGELVIIDNVLTDDLALLANLRQPQSSHSLDIRLAIELSQTIGNCPQQLEIYAASAKKFSRGSGLSAAMEAAAARIVSMISARLQASLHHVIHSNLTAKTMHEQSLINNLVKKIEQIAVEQSPHRLQRVTVELGPLAHISAAHFREHFQQATANTAFANLDLVIECATDINAPNAQDILLKSVDVSEE